MTLTRETVEKLLECGPLRTQLETKLCTALLATWDERDRLANGRDMMGRLWAQEKSRADAAEAKLAERDAEIARLRDAIGIVADEAMTNEILCGHVPPESPEWHRGYDAAISKARALLNKEPKP